MEARPYAPLPPPDPLVHIIIQQDCKKGLRIWSQSKWKKGIAGRNAIHFGTRNVDWECNPFKKGVADACPMCQRGLMFGHAWCTPYRPLRLWPHITPVSRGLSRGVASDFWVRGRIVGRWLTYPRNTLKIEKGAGFGPLHSRICGTSPPKFFTVACRGRVPSVPPLSTPMGMSNGLTWGYATFPIRRVGFVENSPKLFQAATCPSVTLHFTHVEL